MLDSFDQDRRKMSEASTHAVTCGMTSF